MEDSLKEQRQLLESMIKGPKLDIKQIKQIGKRMPNHLLWQDVKNSEEFETRSHALYYSMVGEHDKAIEWATRGLEINTKSAYLFYIRGRSKADIGLLNEGIKDLSDAIRLRADFADAFLERGYALYKGGNVADAIKDVAKARSLEPSIQLPAEIPLRGRGVKIYFWAAPKLKEEDKQTLRTTIVEACRSYFTNTDVGIHQVSDETRPNITEIKVFAPEAIFFVRPCEAPKFYEDFFNRTFELTKAFLNSRSYKLVGYQCDFLYRIGMGEDDLIPIPQIKLEDKKLDE